MKLLAIDTTKKTTILGLNVDGVLYKYTSSSFIPHSKTLMNSIENLLELGNISINELDAIAVVVGPGSFTGTRLSISIAKGLAYPNNIKLISINSLELLRETSNMNNIDAYTILKGISNEAFVLKDNKMYLDNLDNLKQNIGNLQVICASDEEIDILNKVVVDYSIESLVKLANKKYDNNEFVTLAELEPVYLRECQAEIELKRKLNANN